MSLRSYNSLLPVSEEVDGIRTLTKSVFTGGGRGRHRSSTRMVLLIVGDY
jgi:hypothetical protein